jgi:hypothetical protein
VLAETGADLYASSELSRLAEQLGWAIRQFRPDLVDKDCLRNAVNAFFYRPPEGLPLSRQLRERELGNDGVRQGPSQSSSRSGANKARTEHERNGSTLAI